MNKLLVLCCSRGRPKMLKEMIQSFEINSVTSDLYVMLDNCDQLLSDYISCLSDTNINYSITPRTSCTNKINAHINYNYEFMSVTNDDFIYKTPAWDLKLISEIKLSGKHGIAYGNDLCAGVHIPTTSVISREIIKELGWLQLPELKHLFGDNVWNHLGKACKCLHYVENVIIEHRHVFARKMQEDDTFRHTNSAEMYDHDEKIFINWLTGQSKVDIEKVKSIN